ncbi:MAG: hypothetical protein ACTHMK_07490 [Dyella sp.]|uniref:hypothetical protein n=1 Tax=Dyella sp. TaxID=1869338 RepID=UPI003F816853
MNTLEAMASMWASHAARMIWVFTLAVALILVLRRLLRRACGAEAMPLLWWLVPLALAAVQVPHPAVRVDALPPVVVRIAGGGSWAPSANAPGWTIP